LYTTVWKLSVIYPTTGKHSLSPYFGEVDSVSASHLIVSAKPVTSI